MSKLVIYFLRHGETDWNAEGRMQGQTDVPLNDKGRGQATRNGRILAPVLRPIASFDFVASPLIRARETMEIARTELGIDPKVYRTDDRLKEIGFGSFEGRTWADINANELQSVRAREADTYHWVAPGPGGESYALLCARAERWLREVDRDTVCVAHGGIMRMLRLLIEGIEPARAVVLSAPQDQVMLIKAGRISWL